jgi:hypothetical protein
VQNPTRFPHAVLRDGALLLLGAGAVCAVVGGHWMAPSAATEPNGKAALAQTVKVQGADSQYRPSEFPNVMVRSKPATAASASAKTGQSKEAGWIYLKPGTKSLPVPPARRARGTGGGARIERNNSPAGGTVLYLDESRFPSSTVQKQASGQSVLSCVQDGQPHSSADHAAHSTKVIEAK